MCEEVVWVKVLCPGTMGIKPKGFESESGFKSKIFQTRTRESFLKKLKGFESFESESEDSLLY